MMIVILIKKDRNNYNKTLRTEAAQTKKKETLFKHHDLHEGKKYGPGFAKKNI